ncbi:spore coat protein [Bacillus sp. C28GYM-DRY-1]|uniref:spore coat protein n=1 Tax=Bacillus sp. C28GYM-DRY-1 TaxID=3062686 RepID=UPI002675150B|nr:spore coat protein [Bacillus sp. C28GYM-DRY-1]MDO3660521.1 spore coat protein [Bacillus sp. C28GYM-DRY-1]
MNQQNQKISNPQTPVPTTSEMNDRDFVNELLTTEKYMTAAYCTALNEFSHESLYQDIQSIFDESQKAQRKLYDLMFQYGWYSVEAEDAQKLQQSYQKFQQTIQQQSPYQQ